MDPDFSENTLRDYLRIIFKYKTTIITIFITVMIIVFVWLELKTPVYKAQVKMLISAKKQIEAPYYRDLLFNVNSQVALTQSELVNSTPVLERAVKVLKLQKRTRDYEKEFYSPLKARLMDIKAKWLGNSRFKVPKKIESSLSNQEEFRLWRAIEVLKRVIKVEPISNTDLFTITVTDFDPTTAAMIANVVSRSFVICDLEQQLAEVRLRYGERHHIVMQLKDNIDRMTDKLSGMPLSYVDSIGPASIKIVEQAKIPFSPIVPNKSLILTLAFFMSVCAGIMVAFIFEYMNHTFKSAQEVEMFLNLPILGSIPKRKFKSKSLIKNIKRMTSYTQYCQKLSDRIYFLMKNRNLKSLLITAPSPLEGSTAIIANIGNLLSSKLGYKILIIDANLKTPTMHKVFNISDGPGLIDVLEGKVSFEEASQHLSPNLTILTTGKNSHKITPVLNFPKMHSNNMLTGHVNVIEGKVPLNKTNKRLNSKLGILSSSKVMHDPVPVLDSSKMSEVIKSAEEKYELIFVDYANLGNFKDICILSSYLDGIALVVSENKTRRHVIKALMAPLEEIRSNMVGVIFNNRTFVIPKIIYERI